MKIYIDFDGVILDTDSVMMNEFDGDYNSDERRNFVLNYDWSKLMDDRLIINNCIHYIKNSKMNTSLLTRVSSIKEGYNKIKYLRDKGINMDIHIVPSGISKSDVVNAKGNVLIDDKLYNLDKWNEEGGISIFFNKDNNNFDVYGHENTKYPKISDLKLLLDKNYFN